MGEVVYTNHLNLRLKIRKIPLHYPKIIYENPEQSFFDNLEGTGIRIKRLKYNNKLRNMMVAYETKGNKTEIITIHPINDEKMMSGMMSGRWTKNE